VNILVTAIQPNLVCNDHLNISVDGAAGCGITLTPDMLLENFEAGCPASAYRIYVKRFGSQYITNPDGTPRNMNGVRFAYDLFQWQNNQFVKAVHTYEVEHVYGNRCWGTFTPEDKLPPVVNCGPIRQIFCYEVDAFLAETQANARFRPTMSDNCGLGEVTKTDHKFLDGCNGGTIKRKWLVKDASGNQWECEQHFMVINEVNWMCPDPLVELTCKDRTSPDDIYDLVFARTPGNAATKDTTAVKAAYPFKKDLNNRVIFNPNVTLTANKKGGVLHGMCSYYTTYNDLEIGACGNHCHGNKKVIRTWTVLDWCNASEGPYTCTQVIKAVDVTPPTAIVKDTMVSTRPWDCTADFYLPNPWELHDDCDIDPKWSVKGPVGVTMVDLRPNGVVVSGVRYYFRALGAPCGDHIFKYTLTDCCGNENVLPITVKVVDRTPPTPIAKRDIVISLTPGYFTDSSGVLIEDGQAKLFAAERRQWIT
jgi:hypothetical protein